MIKTRFAPSPTGQLHLGSCRTATMAFAYARKTGGKCILRIEDTDHQRSTRESLLDIVEGLEWLGIEFDSGPSIDEIRQGKKDKQYFQSQRADIYNQYIDKLVQEGKAYINNDGVTIFRMPAEDVTYVDTILGEITFPASDLKDFPIRRADGSVLFHACVCIDDALSGVTNVIRANDHSSNTPKHIQLYRAFGFATPTYSHMPLLLDDKGAKLSKRRTDQCVLIKDFREKGFLPSAVINMIGLMGWKNPKGQEVFGLDYLCENFDIKDCLPTNARYDAAKMLSLNHTHIKNMSVADFEKALYNWAKDFAPDFLEKFDQSDIEWHYFCRTFKDRCKVLSDIIPLSKFLFEDVVYDEKQTNKHFKDNVLELLKDKLDAITAWNETEIDKAINAVMQETNLAIGKVAQPLRVATTGGVSPEIIPTLVLLGREKTLERLNYCISNYLGIKV